MLHNKEEMYDTVTTARGHMSALRSDHVEITQTVRLFHFNNGCDYGDGLGWQRRRCAGFVKHKNENVGERRRGRLCPGVKLRPKKLRLRYLGWPKLPGKRRWRTGGLRWRGWLSFELLLLPPLKWPDSATAEHSYLERGAREVCQSCGARPRAVDWPNWTVCKPNQCVWLLVTLHLPTLCFIELQ